VPSATGEGTHRRWICAQDSVEQEQERVDLGSSAAPHQTCASEDASTSQRFITPASTLTQHYPDAPRKSTSGHRNTITPISPLGEAEEGTIRLGGVQIIESQSQEREPQFLNPSFLASLAFSTTAPAQQFQPTPPCDPSHSETTLSQRQALGPTGALLVNEESNPILVYARRALGPNGTVLIDDNGETIYEQVDGMSSVE